MLNRTVCHPTWIQTNKKDNDKSKANDMHDGCPPKGKGCNAQKGKKLPNAWLADDECILPNEPNLTLPYLMAYTTTLGIHVTAKGTRFMKHNVKSWMKVQFERWPCCPPLIKAMFSSEKFSRFLVTSNV
jgi:hypothetical protein